MYIVSACVAGFNTRFDGGNRLDERVRKLVLEKPPHASAAFAFPGI